MKKIFLTFLWLGISPSFATPALKFDCRPEVNSPNQTLYVKVFKDEPKPNQEAFTATVEEETGNGRKTVIKNRPIEVHYGRPGNPTLYFEGSDISFLLMFHVTPAAGVVEGVTDAGRSIKQHCILK